MKNVKKYHKWNSLKHGLYRIKVRFHKWAIKKFPFCHGTEGPCFHKGKRQRQNTAYVDDEKNWVFLCRDCAAINTERWDERWNEYYAGCM